LAPGPLEGHPNAKQQLLSHYLNQNNIASNTNSAIIMSSSTNPKKRDWKQESMDNKYAKRIITTCSKDASQNQCAHCKLQFPGARALGTHLRYCKPVNCNKSDNKVNKSTAEKQVLKYNDDNEFSHQYNSREQLL
jgi:hypothetical protein